MQLQYAASLTPCIQKLVFNHYGKLLYVSVCKYYNSKNEFLYNKTN
jgi:hypothetical protein